MKQFAYRVRNKNGESSNGIIESLNSQQAVRTLQERKLLVISLTERRSIDLKKLLSGEIFNSVSGRELANFTQLLSTMMSTGLPLTDALSNLIIQQKQGYFREILQSLLHNVQAGMTLSDAMSQCGNVFSELYINIVKAGEASGKVDEALKRMSESMETELEFRGKLSGAMTYPIVLVVVMTGIGTFMITSIIPQIANVYKEYNAQLPLPTMILMGFATAIKDYFLVVLFALLVLVFIYRALRKNRVSDYLINNSLFNAPIFGKLNEETLLVTVCRTLAILLASGVAILEALKIVSKAVGNNKFRIELLDTAGGVEKGLPLSAAIRRNPDFPLMIAQLVAIGEETGTVDQSLEHLAKFYQDSAERRIKAVTTLFEPLMLLMMGGLIGGLAIAVLLPIFNLSNVITR